MPVDRTRLVIGQDEAVSCPDCGCTRFELYDPDQAMNDAATFSLRKKGDHFERMDPHGGYTWETMWHREDRRVGCVECKRRDDWPAFDLAAGGIRCGPIPH
jgi:hypothetical protein